MRMTCLDDSAYAWRITLHRTASVTCIFGIGIQIRLTDLVRCPGSVACSIRLVSSMLMLVVRMYWLCHEAPLKIGLP